MMNSTEIVCFSDGACRGNGKLDAVASSAVFFPFDLEFPNRTIVIPTDQYPATNQRAELTAVIMALDITKGSGRPLCIYSDSKYAIGIYLHPTWNYVKNTDLVDQIKALLLNRKVKFIHVKSHQTTVKKLGIPQNIDTLIGLRIDPRPESVDAVFCNGVVDSLAQLIITDTALGRQTTTSS